MSGWADGYVSDGDYLRSFQGQMAPAHLRCLLLLRRRRLPDLARPWRFLDLGCGNGFTTAVLAAANPQGEFIGVDFAPDQILRARDLAAAAGIGNARFIEASFAELLDMPERVGDIDFLACHGVYTWVNRENRRHIVEVMKRHVVPGGLVYMGYNAMPGWAPLAPLRHLITRLADSLPDGKAEEAIAEAFDAFEELSSQGAVYMTGNAAAVRGLQSLRDKPKSYLAHELLPTAATAIWHDEVAHDLEAARLSYVGSAQLIENFDSMNIPTQLRDRIAAGEKRGVGEIFRDLAVNRTFRMDVFARGAPQASAADAEAAFNELAVALPAAPVFPPRFRASYGEAEIDEESSRPLLETLADGPMTVRDLVSRAEGNGLERRRARQALVGLIAGGIVLPLADASPPEEARDSCMRYNRAALAAATEGHALPALASPKLGNGLVLGGSKQRALASAIAARANTAPSGALPEADGLAELGDQLPYLRQLGVIDA